MVNQKETKGRGPSAADTAMEKLIRDTVHALGDVDPADLPHLLRQRLQGQIAGDLDVETYLKRVTSAPATPKES